MVWYQSDWPKDESRQRRCSIDRPCVSVLAAGMGGLHSYSHWTLRSDGAAIPTKEQHEMSSRHGPQLKHRRLAIPVDAPAPAVMTEGIGNVNRSQYYVEQDSMNIDAPAPAVLASAHKRVTASSPRKVNDSCAFDLVGTAAAAAPSTPGKPPFVPLTMGQIRAVPLHGLTHVSTFSGGGGTCLGFRLAGFRTLWANDIEEHARESYAANLESSIDGRDIRQLQAADILSAIGLQAGALDVFEGSPPCTAFSTAGKRAAGWQQTKDHAGHVQTNVEDLFFDWLRLVDGLRPRAFVAENVAGLVKGVAKGYFKEILRQMKRLGYRTEARLLDAQWLGVPQQRCRIIFIGIREDLETDPRFPLPLPYRYSVREALPWITAARYDTSGQFRGKPEFVDAPCPAIIGSSHPGRNAGHYKVKTGEAVVGQLAVGPGFTRQAKTLDDPSPAHIAGTNFGGEFILTSGARRKFTIDELKRICSFPDDYAFAGSYAQQWARLGNSVPPLMAYAIAVAVRDVLLPLKVRRPRTSRRR